MIDSLILALATGLGLGWLPFAPGTFGSLLGVPLAWWLLRYRVKWQIAAAAGLATIAIPLCDGASSLLGGGDAPMIVADEYLAFPLACLALPKARRALWLGAAFMLFRIVDIAKVPPIGNAESLGGGLGIVLDDVIATPIARAALELVIQARRRLRRS